MWCRDIVHKMQSKENYSPQFQSTSCVHVTVILGFIIVFWILAEFALARLLIWQVNEAICTIISIHSNACSQLTMCFACSTANLNRLHWWLWRESITRTTNSPKKKQIIKNVPLLAVCFRFSSIWSCMSKLASHCDCVVSYSSASY